MIKFTLLSIKNFLSYGADPTIIPLDTVGTTLILGEDLDNTSHGKGGNGAGKTAIINALTYGIYDKPVSDITKDKLVNNINKRHMEVIVEFEKNGNNYRIRRVRKEKAHAAGNYVELLENGVDITPDSIVNTNKLVEKIVGMPYDLFVRIVVFSANNNPFLDLPVRSQNGPNQTDIIEELFNLKTLSEKSSILQEQRKELEIELKMQKDRVNLLEQEQDRHQKQLESAKQRIIIWDKNTKQEIKTLTQKLEQLKTIDVDQQTTLHEEIIECKIIVNDAEQTQKELASKAANLQKQLKQSEKELIHLEDEKCPYCLQQYVDANKKIKETKILIRDVEKDLEPLLNQLEQITNTVDDSRSNYKSLEKQIKIPKNELDQLHEKVSEYQRRIDELNNARNPYTEPLEELEAIEFDTIDHDKINNLDRRIEHMKFLYKILTKKDSFVRKVLLNKNLPFLNQRLQEYLTNLGLTHQVEFTHEMTANITQFGRTMDFGNLSNGQRARVNIALSFAFRDVLQQLYQRINICMLDEVLDVGLDGPGVTAAARMLKRKAREENLSLYIISHRDEIDSAFDRILTVQLSDGFSTIQQN